MSAQKPRLRTRTTSSPPQTLVTHWDTGYVVGPNLSDGTLECGSRHWSSPRNQVGPRTGVRSVCSQGRKSRQQSPSRKGSRRVSCSYGCRVSEVRRPHPLSPGRTSLCPVHIPDPFLVTGRTHPRVSPYLVQQGTSTTGTRSRRRKGPVSRQVISPYPTSHYPSRRHKGDPRHSSYPAQPRDGAPLESRETDDGRVYRSGVSNPVPLPSSTLKWGQRGLGGVSGNRNPRSSSRRDRGHVWGRVPWSRPQCPSGGSEVQSGTTAVLVPHAPTDRAGQTDFGGGGYSCTQETLPVSVRS